MNRNTEFRTDIAGLRALAVMLVLLSHFEIPGFEFGFIGVDIFFVISGFLITRILYKDYLKNNQGSDDKAALNLASFYLRRIRRLLPAALVVIIAVNIVSYFLYNPESRNELLLNSKWALLFLANVAFLRSGTDYFQQTSEPSMLQHYWSLSIEEQFYFIWPLLFLIAASFHKMKVRAKYFRFNKRILILIGVASFASFIFLQQGFKVAPVAAYFSIFSRAWELGIGSFLGILAFHKKPDAFYSRSEQYLPLIFALLLAALTTTRSNWALLIPIPVLATGIFLYVGQGQAKAEVGKSRLLKCARRMLLYIGAISYSLYLVHWPIFIIASHLGFINGLVSKLTLIPVSIFFAHLLWKLIEIPFQSIILPKPFNFEEIAFNFFKRRRLAIYTLTFCIIGSLYVVTYPSVSGGLINSDSKMAAIANDPAILKYSDYQANIVNPADINSAQNLNLNPQDSGTVTNVSLSDLLATNTMMLQNGLEQSQLTQIGKQFFPQLSRDMNAFETSSCSKTDLEIPPDCSIRGTDIAAKKIAIIGDSKMAQFAQPIMDYFKVRGWAIYPYVSTGCRIYAPVNSDIFTNCTKRSAWVKNQIKNNSFDLVIGASYPEGFMVEHIASPYLDEIIKASKQTILLTQFTRVENPRACIKADYTYQPSCSQLHDVEMASYKQNKKFLMSKSSPKVHVIDTTVWTCIENKCPMVVGDIFLTRDGSHLSNSFIKKITPIINATLDSISAW